MREAGSDDNFLETLTAGARLLTGWACVAVAALDLGMGVSAHDGPYLLFHVVLLAGGLLLLAFDHVPKKPRPMAHAATAGFAIAATLISAIPRASSGCCMHYYAGRHGFPFAILASSPRRFVAGHVLADLLFWYLAGLIVLVVATLVLPARPALRITRPPHRPAHAEHRATGHRATEHRATGQTVTDAASDENVRGLP